MEKQTPRQKMLKKIVKEHDWKLTNDFEGILKEAVASIKKIKKNSIEAIEGGLKEINAPENLKEETLKMFCKDYENINFTALWKNCFWFWNEVANQLETIINNNDYEKIQTNTDSSGHKTIQQNDRVNAEKRDKNEMP